MVSKSAKRISILITLKLCKDKKLLWNLREGEERREKHIAAYNQTPTGYKLRLLLPTFTARSLQVT
jgi:hypothetical protein